MQQPRQKRYLVLDFEANCSGENVRDHEIVEFPAVLCDENGTELASFRRFVRPVRLKQISGFIKKLTGISDEIVNKNGVDWSQALAEFEQFCVEHCFGPDRDTTIVTCGDWDVSDFLLLA